MTESHRPVIDSLHATVRLPASKPSSSTPTTTGDLIALSAVPLRTESGRYELRREIGRGGMGAVFRGVDRSLDRELAIKVLLPQHLTDPPQVRRFQKEAWVVAQLQHPGIVPLYDTGRLDDGRPYFVMKLIEGRTLAALLAARRQPTDDRPRLLQIFELVCQTIAYAHSRGVVHRDLKPSNVMVGEFGEVQVMDWGLARVMGEEPPAASTEVAPESPAAPTVSLRGHPLADSTCNGDIIGTPAYMAPEQARGDTYIDERVDVFGLGAILCEILTGQPPYPAADATAALAQAARAEQTGTAQRLASCGADPDLTRLASDCLNPDPAKRPATAGEVADRLAAYLAGAEARLREAELDRAAAVARAKEERKQRRLTVALAFAVVWIIALTGFVTIGIVHQRLRRADEQARLAQEQRERKAQLVRRIDRELAEAERFRELAEQRREQLANLARALNAARRAEQLLAEGVDDPELAERITHTIQSLERTEEMARREGTDQRMIKRLEEIRLMQSELKDEQFDFDSALPAYMAAFRSYGIDVEALSVDEAAQRVAESHIKPELTAAIFNWALLVRSLRKDGDDLFPRLLEIANRVDSDPWNRSFREAVARNDITAIRQLADKLDLQRAAAAVVHLYIEQLWGIGDQASAIGLVRRAVRRFPSDFWLNHQCGYLLVHSQLRHLDEGIRYLTAAVALRPQSPGAHVNLGFALQMRGEYQAAVERTREAIRLRPDYIAAHNNIGASLARLGRYDEAAKSLRRAIELQPNNVKARTNLADVLVCTQRYLEAVEIGRNTLLINPEHPQALLIQARALQGLKQLDEAEQVARQAVKLQPNRTETHFILGNVLMDQRRWKEAADCFDQAIRLMPEHAEAYCNLGDALGRMGRFAEAYQAVLRGHQLGSQRANWQYPSARWLRDAERMLALDRLLHAVRIGKAIPQNAIEALNLAHFSYGRKNDPVFALEMFDFAFKKQPDLTTGPVNSHRTWAIHAAAAVQSNANDELRTRWRGEALAWLRADRDFWQSRQQSAEAAKDRDEIRTRLTAPEFSSLRDPQALQKMPEAERKQWQNLWDDLRAMIKR